MSEISGRELVMTRVFNAPRELVFRAWTDREHVGTWWGPDGFTTTTQEMDVRPGGVWRYVMHGPDGVDYQNLIVYREVSPPERLVYDHGGDGGEVGGDVHFHVTVTFEEQGDQTRLTMRSVFPNPEDLQRVIREYGALEGAKQHLARLAEYLAKKG